MSVCVCVCVCICMDIMKKLPIYSRISANVIQSEIYLMRMFFFSLHDHHLCVYVFVFNGTREELVSSL